MKEEVRIAKEEVKQQPSETKPEVRPKQQEQPPATSEAKEEKKEKPLEIEPSPLTEEEWQRLGEGEWYHPKYVEEKEALKYMRVLLEGDDKSIRWYSERAERWAKSMREGFKKEPSSKEIEKARRDFFKQDICNVIKVLGHKKSKEGFDLIIEVLKRKRGYPRVIVCAIKSSRFYPIWEGDFHGRKYGSKDIVPLMKELIKEEARGVRLEAAVSFLFLRDANTALPVLDEVAKEGATAALGYIFHEMEGKKWEKKGLEIIKRAYTYENKETKALAALFLIQLNEGDKKVIENTLITIAEEIVSKPKWEDPSRGYNDRRALETIIIALNELKSKRAIPLLKRIAEHPEASYLKRDANNAIDYLSKVNGWRNE